MTEKEDGTNNLEAADGLGAGEFSHKNFNEGMIMQQQIIKTYQKSFIS